MYSEGAKNSTNADHVNIITMPPAHPKQVRWKSVLDVLGLLKSIRKIGYQNLVQLQLNAVQEN